MLPVHLERRHLVLAAAGCVALGAVAAVDPSRIPIGPPCPLRTLTGLDCPLCGATRATHALTRGDVGAALDFNALYVAALPVVAAALLFWLIRGRLPGVGGRWSTAAIVAIAVAFGVLRNLPFAPLTVLAS